MSWKILIIALVFIILGAGAYMLISNISYTRHITLPPNMLAGSSTDADAAAALAASSTSAGIFGLTDPSLASPASSTADVSSWKAYSNAASEYSLKFPADLSVNADTSGNLVLAFPKDHYFHWPLLDDAKVTITASSSCSSVISDVPGRQPEALVLNGYHFVRTEGGDVGAGNIYHELAYDTVSNGICYHIDLLDHGANGAGLYVGDQSLIASYDAVHKADLTAVLGIFNAMVNTFRLAGNVI